MQRDRAQPAGEALPHHGSIDGLVVVFAADPVKVAGFLLAKREPLDDGRGRAADRQATRVHADGTDLKYFTAPNESINRR